jgi:hypothetical protein
MNSENSIFLMWHTKCLLFWPTTINTSRLNDFASNLKNMNFYFLRKEKNIFTVKE